MAEDKGEVQERGTRAGDKGRGKGGDQGRGTRAGDKGGGQGRGCLMAKMDGICLPALDRGIREACIASCAIRNMDLGMQASHGPPEEA